MGPVLSKQSLSHEEPSPKTCSKVKIEYYKAKDNAISPQYGLRRGWYEICADSSIQIPPGQTQYVDTGLCFVIPKDHVLIQRKCSPEWNLRHLGLIQNGPLDHYRRRLQLQITNQHPQVAIAYSRGDPLLEITLAKYVPETILVDVELEENSTDSEDINEKVDDEKSEKSVDEVD